MSKATTPAAAKAHLALAGWCVILSGMTNPAHAAENPQGKVMEVDYAKAVRVVLPEKPNDLLERIVAVFARQVEKRCPAKVATQGDAPLTVALSLDPAIGKEGFRIRDRADGGIEVVGQNERGVLYGLGKLLRTSRYSKDGFAPGAWRGESIPQKEVRGIYFATHFHNFYHDGPVEEIQRYVEELALWGCNSLMVCYDMHHFNGFKDPEAVAFRKRLGAILQAAGDLGVATAFVVAGNEGYANSPKEMRAQGGGRGAIFKCYVCPNKPGGMKYIVDTKKETMAWMKLFNPKHYLLWAFDSGGCAVEGCHPWATSPKGFLKCARELAKTAREELPGVKIILSNWFYNGRELQTLGKILSAEKPWVDYVMGPVPGTTIPAVNFPEISMLGVQPWGGFGAIPVPHELQRKYAKMANLQGGWPYSEGLFEDMNKAMMLQLYWNPKQPVLETIEEYAGFEFAPEVAKDVVSIVKTLEKNFRRRRNVGADAVTAYALAQKVDAKLPAKVRTSWRWRILYLRALIDKEMHLTKGRLQGELLRDAFAELTRIYHAENAPEGWLKPPQVK